jgi:uncharacterized protein (UPF0297 family)
MSGKSDTAEIVVSGEREERSIEHDRSRGVIETVCEALVGKGYDPISQMTNYLITGDPHFITMHNKARFVVREVSRSDILDVLLMEYLFHHGFPEQ